MPADKDAIFQAFPRAAAMHVLDPAAVLGGDWHAGDCKRRWCLPDWCTSAPETEDKGMRLQAMLEAPERQDSPILECGFRGTWELVGAWGPSGHMLELLDGARLGARVPPAAVMLRVERVDSSGALMSSRATLIRYQYRVLGWDGKAWKAHVEGEAHKCIERYPGR